MTPRHPDSSLPVTEAAIAAYRRLQTCVGARLLAYERPDGGLICEQDRGPGRAVFYPVTAAGTVESDQLLDWGTLRFAPAPLPAGLV
jgi:hypothetical protein